MFVTHFREVEWYFEMFADIIGKKDGNKKFCSSATSWSVRSMTLEAIRQRTFSWCGSAIRSLVMSWIEGRTVCREWLGGFAETTVLEKRSRGTCVGRMTAD